MHVLSALFNLLALKLIVVNPIYFCYNSAPTTSSWCTIIAHFRCVSCSGWSAICWHRNELASHLVWDVLPIHPTFIILSFIYCRGNELTNRRYSIHASFFIINKNKNPKNVHNIYLLYLIKMFILLQILDFFQILK